MVLRTPRRATAAADHPRSGASAVGGFGNDRLRLGIGRRFTPRPILLDLDGNGIRIAEQSRSGMFVDAGGDGLQHRTAWAAAGDGVKFYDPDGTGAITEKRQYVFTEWDPTATDDLAALRSVFDGNGDGVLNASDAAFASFKVMVTNPDGSTTAMTLAIRASAQSQARRARSVTYTS